MSGREETPYEEAAELSAQQGSALAGMMGDDEDYGFDDPDIDDLNNPDVESLAEPPLLGARPKPVDLGFGDEAQAFGRATSPKLYASAAQFPTACQFRVWKWENGVPVGLGAIDAEATEEDFVRAFMPAMPKAGQGNFQFRMRPIDIRGQELGKEFTINISEHHATLRQIRDIQKREEEERMNGGGAGTWGRHGGDVIINGGGQGYDAGASYAEEMGRMFEQAVESAEEQNRVLRSSLEMERDRLREEEKTRAEERVSMAERSAQTVEKMMERLMASDRNRSEEQMKTQQEHSGFMMQTLTQVFAQQQESARQQSERMREQDTAKLQQDREFFDRQRQEMELRRQRERDEAESRRRAEKEELEARRQGEREEAERRRRSDMEEWERKRVEERERLTADQRRWEESRKYEAEQIRLEAQRREAELERRREQEKEEGRVRIEREKMELEARRQEIEDRRRREQQEFERKMQLEREERERREAAGKEERERQAREFERKLQMEREERERRERSDRERWERDRAEQERKREEERREWERREQLRREEMQREADRRREEMQVQMKQMEMNAQRDREHSERMAEMARLEREAQREAQLAREKAERDARDQAERDRQRQFDLQKFEMEQAKERDREHAERMMQMQKIQSAGGLSGITDMLGMETPEVLAKIFGAGAPEEGGGWADAIPKVLGAIAEVGAKTLGGPPPGDAPGGRRPRARKAAGQGQKMIPIQTPDGVKMISSDALAQIQAARAQPGIPMPVRPVPEEEEEIDFGGLPMQSFSPGFAEEEEGGEEAESEEAPMSTPEFRAATRVNPIKRAKAAGMKFSEQRAARRAIRELMPKLEAASEDEWLGVITESLVKTPAIYEYLKAVSVYVALAEAKVTPELAEKTVAEMKKSGMIPEEVPYDEADFARMAEAPAASEAPDAD